jgi:signal transduction histidine kinase/CheY-like chemotaxis protein
LRARTALEEALDIDRATFLTLDGTTVWCEGVARRVSADDGRRLAGLSGARVAEPSEEAAAALVRTLEGPPALLTSPPSLVLWAKLERPSTRPQVLLCGWRGRKTSVSRDLPGPQHEPFLELLAELLAHALDGAEMSARLARTGEALTESSRHLQRAVQDLEGTRAQLSQAQRLEALGRLSGGVVHDFNNLLTVILTHAQLVLPCLTADSAAEEDLQVVLDATRRAGDLARRLLSFGRKSEHRRPQADLNAVVTDLSRLLARLVGDGVHLQLDLDPSVGRVAVDPVELEQILMNLSVNARDAMPEGGRLVVETRWARPDDVQDAPFEVSDMVALSVIDSGTGMDEATRRSLFEPFFTTKAPGRGTGLGLATVHGLVTENRGHLAVESELGRGSRFTVLLPTREAERSGPSPTGPAMRRGRALVVEDEEAIRRVMCRLLRGAGFEVAAARTGAEALDSVATSGPLDLVVTDVVLPQMSGPELVRRLRASRPQLRVLYVSGHGAANLGEVGGEPLVPKPFTSEQLLAEVDAMFPVDPSSWPTPEPTGLP